MQIFLDPNVAYLLLASGMILVILALLSPGTGWLEILALFSLVLAGYSVVNLPPLQLIRTSPEAARGSWSDRVQPQSEQQRNLP